MTEKWLMDLIDAENEKILPVIGECEAGKLEVRAFLLEQYVRAMKASKIFDKDVYREINEKVHWTAYCAAVHKSEDPEQVKRELQVAALINEIRKLTRS